MNQVMEALSIYSNELGVDSTRFRFDHWHKNAFRIFVLDNRNKPLTKGDFHKISNIINKNRDFEKYYEIPNYWVSYEIDVNLQPDKRIVDYFNLIKEETDKINQIIKKLESTGIEFEKNKFDKAWEEMPVAEEISGRNKNAAVPPVTGEREPGRHDRL
jgi:hypothetical protein